MSEDKLKFYHAEIHRLIQQLTTQLSFEGGHTAIRINDALSHLVRVEMIIEQAIEARKDVSDN